MGKRKFEYGYYGNTFDPTNKATATSYHVSYMLNRTRSMFRYDGLPDTIPERSLELFLQTNGNVCIAKHNDNLYCFVGGLGGEPDAYYMPTIYTVGNPALKLSRNYTIGKDCVVISNDSLYLGLLPLFEKYASAMTENELSLHIASINARMVDLITAPDDRTKESAEKYIHDIIDGKISVIAENAFLDGLRVRPTSTTANNAITNLIEYEQYLKASWYNEIGLNANYNMKRESINAGESQLNNDALLPLVDDMLNCRKMGVEKVNKMFGTEISVSLASSWEDNEIEIENEQNSTRMEKDSDEPRSDDFNRGGTANES